MLHDFEELIGFEPWLKRHGSEVKSRLEGRLPVFVIKQIDTILGKTTTEFAAPALFFIQRATMDNNYLSAAVRLQSDRGQQVVSTRVYAIVRHPLYLGLLLTLVGTPLMTGSLFGLILSLLVVGSLVFCIHGEEKMLLEELEGYAEYKQKVKYHLIPFVW